MLDTIALCSGGDGSWVAKKVTLEFKQRMHHKLVLRDRCGFRMDTKLILDWHVAWSSGSGFGRHPRRASPPPLGSVRRVSSAWGPPTTTGWTRWSSST